ncbi:MAG: hypothetical protein M1594_01530 [Candidatus Marsarchaeota archaeon]|nr:hypothetical protein [Candidatus Marsarchaeota archaeon]
MEYTERDVEGLIGQAVQKGAILAVLFFDSYGVEKPAVQNALVDVTQKVTKEPGVIYCKGVVREPIEKNGEFSTYSEVKVLAESFNALVNIVLKYAPSSIEVEKPGKINLSLEEAHATLLDISQTIQNYTSFIIEKTLTGEEKRKYNEELKRKSEFIEGLKAGKKG